MSDTTEQRLASEAYSPEPNTELHKLPVLDDTEELIEMSEEFTLQVLHETGNVCRGKERAFGD